MKNNINIDKTTEKILIIGANGFLGLNIFKILDKKENKDQNFSFIAADLRNINIPTDFPFFHIDITNSGETLKKIKKISPDIIILTAALTNVDQCEIHKKIAKKININGSKNVIKACRKNSSKLIFISTDFVFDGTKKNGNYNELDTPNPINYYGKTKFEAEKALINSEIEYLICRTSVLYGWNKTKFNFIIWILDKLKHNEKISIVFNQINSPTFVNNLAGILLKLIEKDIQGILHSAGDCALNRYEMAIKCAEIFNYDKDLIEKIEFIKQKALRPNDVSLDINKLKNIIGNESKIFSLDDGLKYMKNHEET